MAEKDIVYRSTVRLGNWYEDLCLEKDEIKQFLEERKKNQLLVQKARALFGNFYKEVLLGVASEHVKFGSVIQLIPTDINICQDIYKFPGQTPALAIVINEKVVKTTQKINNKCEVTLAYMNSPCIRNSFLLNKKDCLVDEGLATDVLKYGESFRLQILEADEGPLFIYSAPMNADLSTMVDITYTSSMNGQVNNSVGLCLQRESKFDYFLNISQRKHMQIECESRTPTWKWKFVLFVL